MNQTNQAGIHLAPIALFVYNRCEHTRRTIESLRHNFWAAESDLFIFSDAAKQQDDAGDVQLVRDYIKQIHGFKSVTVVEREKNFGLARSIIEGVTSTLKTHKSIVVLEDDMVTSPYFLQFMKEGLMRYKDNTKVASIHGYVYPIDGLPETFFMRGADCWGWATWRDRWEMFEKDGEVLLEKLERRGLIKYFDFNDGYPFSQMLKGQIAGKNNSWAIRWHASAFLNDKLTLYPGKSLVLNIGNDGSGAHSGITSDFSSDVSMKPVYTEDIAVAESALAFGMFEEYFKKQAGGIVKKLRRRLSRLFVWFVK